MIDRATQDIIVKGFIRTVDRSLLPGAASHILLPRVATRLAAAARLLLPSKGSSDLGSIGGNVDVDNATIRSGRPRQREACVVRMMGGRGAFLMA